MTPPVAPPVDPLPAFSLEVLETTPVELTLLQQRSRSPSAPPPAQLLLLLLRADGAKGEGAKGEGAKGDGAKGEGAKGEGASRLLSCSERQRTASVNAETILTVGRYVALPLSLEPGAVNGGALGAGAFTGSDGLPFVLRIGSVKPLLCAPAPLPPAAARAALVSYIKQGDQSEPFPGMYMYNLQDGCGFLVLAENASGSNAMSVQLDHSECVNLIPSRGSLTTYDTLPPKHVQILQVLSRAAEADCVMLVSANFRSEPWMGGESLHSPGVVEGGVHDPQRQAPGGARGSGGKLLGALSRLRF